MLHSKPYEHRVRAFIIDEAHTVKEWCVIVFFIYTTHMDNKKPLLIDFNFI